MTTLPDSLLSEKRRDFRSTLLIVVWPLSPPFSFRAFDSPDSHNTFSYIPSGDPINPAVYDESARCDRFGLRPVYQSLFCYDVLIYQNRGVTGLPIFPLPDRAQITCLLHVHFFLSVIAFFLDLFVTGGNVALVTISLP